MELSVSITKPFGTSYGLGQVNPSHCCPCLLRASPVVVNLSVPEPNRALLVRLHEDTKCFIAKPRM